MSIRIGYKASAEQFGPRELVELAVEAERRGMDSVLVSDHFQPWRHRGGHAPFSVAWMSAVGERTSRVQLGTSVLTPTFRYNPAVIAQAFGTMGCLFPGRVMLGLGTGEALNEIAVSGAPWPAFHERFDRLSETVHLVRRLWSEERVDFKGDYYHTVKATVYDRPDVPPPIYVGAGGPKVAHYAGTTADGVICTSGKGMDLYRDSLLPALGAGLAEADRPASSVERTIEIKMSFDLDRDRAVGSTRFWAPLALSAEQKADLGDPIDMERAGDELPIEQVVRRWIVASDPEEAVAHVRPYVEAGFTHLVFHAPTDDQRRFLATFERHLAPRLRELGERVRIAS